MLLRSVLVLVAATSMASAAPRASRPADPDPFAVELERIAPGVYGFFERDLNAIVSANIIAVVGTRDVLVFDSGHHPLSTRAIIARLKTITSRPVRYLVVSHWHDDHWVGNAEFAAAWPSVQVIAHPVSAGLIEQRKDAFRGEPCRAELKDGAEELRQLLAKPTRADGTPVSEASLVRTRHFLAGYEAERDQCEARVFKGVDRTVDSFLTVELGDRCVDIRFLGRGNTGGDLVAVLPANRIILTGDLLVAPFPFATQSFISEWARVLRTIERMDVSTLVPGHGPVQHDPRYLRDVAEVLESIERQARAAYTTVMTAEQLKAKVDLGAFHERFAHGDRFLQDNFDYMLGKLAVERMWEELTGHFKPETP